MPYGNDNDTEDYASIATSWDRTALYVMRTLGGLSRQQSIMVARIDQQGVDLVLMKWKVASLAAGIGAIVGAIGGATVAVVMQKVLGH